MNSSKFSSEVIVRFDALFARGCFVLPFTEVLSRARSSLGGIPVSCSP